MYIQYCIVMYVRQLLYRQFVFDMHESVQKENKKNLATHCTHVNKTGRSPAACTPKLKLCSNFLIKL